MTLFRKNDRPPEPEVVEAEVVSDTSEEQAKPFDLDTVKHSLLRKIATSMYENPSFWKYIGEHKWIVSADSYFTIQKYCIHVKKYNSEMIELTNEEISIVSKLFDWYLSNNQDTVNSEKSKQANKQLNTLLEALDRL